MVTIRRTCLERSDLVVEAVPCQVIMIIHTWLQFQTPPYAVRMFIQENASVVCVYWRGPVICFVRNFSTIFHNIVLVNQPDIIYVVVEPKATYTSNRLQMTTEIFFYIWRNFHDQLYRKWDGRGRYISWKNWLCYWIHALSSQYGHEFLVQALIFDQGSRDVRTDTHRPHLCPLMRHCRWPTQDLYNCLQFCLQILDLRSNCVHWSLFNNQITKTTDLLSMPTFVAYVRVES